jgi:hypothetical protein
VDADRADVGRLNHLAGHIAAAKVGGTIRFGTESAERRKSRIVQIAKSLFEMFPRTTALEAQKVNWL